MCAFVGGILEFVSPAKSKKTMRIICAAVLISVTILPFLSLDTYDIVPEISEETDNNYSAISGTAVVLKKSLYKSTEETLISLGVNEYEIYIEVSTDESENTVTLESLKILVGDEFRNMTDEIEKAFSEDYSEVLTVGVKENE